LFINIDPLHPQNNDISIHAWLGIYMFSGYLSAMVANCDEITVTKQAYRCCRADYQRQPPRNSHLIPSISLPIPAIRSRISAHDMGDKQDESHLSLFQHEDSLF
jgi:hypothetical protein